MYSILGKRGLYGVWWAIPRVAVTVGPYVLPFLVAGVCWWARTLAVQLLSFLPGTLPSLQQGVVSRNPGKEMVWLVLHRSRACQESHCLTGILLASSAKWDGICLIGFEEWRARF